MNEERLWERALELLGVDQSAIRARMFCKFNPKQGSAAYRCVVLLTDTV